MTIHPDRPRSSENPRRRRLAAGIVGALALGLGVAAPYGVASARTEGQWHPYRALGFIGSPTAAETGGVWFPTDNGRLARRSPEGEYTSWRVPGGQPSVAQIAWGGGQDLWFTVETNANDQIGRIDRRTGTITEYPLSRGSGPHGIALGADGNMWFTEYLAGRIGRITPTGSITEYALPTAGAQPTNIALGRDGNMWFTEEGTRRIGRVTPEFVLTEFPSGTGHPLDITAGADGAMWFTKVDVEREGIRRLGRITMRGAVTQYRTGHANPTTVTTGPDGNVWFNRFHWQGVGRITPTGHVRQFPMGGNHVVEDLTADPYGNIWTQYSLVRSDKLVRITTSVDPTTRPARVRGTGIVGDPLRCRLPRWASAPLDFSISWFVGRHPIAAADIGRYTPRSRDVGRRVSCKVTASLPGMVLPTIARSVNSIKVHRG